MLDTVTELEADKDGVDDVDDELDLDPIGVTVGVNVGETLEDTDAVIVDDKVGVIDPVIVTELVACVETVPLPRIVAVWRIE